MENRVLVKDKYFKKFISEAAILNRVEEISKDLKKDYQSKNPIFIGVLNGAFMFASDLMKAIDFDAEITFTKLASYEAMTSSGDVKTLIGLKKDIQNRDVIVIEDIIDTGRTMHHFLKVLQAQNPTSISIVTLLCKPDAIVYPLEINHIGFDIDNKFVIGYGLDYDEYGRQYRDIYQLDV